jgi:hypothetical protein
MADFFDNKTEDTKVNDDNQTQTQAEIEVAGEKYSQADLEKMVGLAKTAEVIERNHGKLEQVASDYGRRADEIGRLKKENEELKNRTLQTKSETQSLSLEEQRQLAQRQAKDLGLMTDQEFDQKFQEKYVQQRSAEKLLEDINNIIDDAQETGKPKPTTEAILKYMQDTGFRNPEKAYKDMYEKELAAWNEQKMSQVKPNTMFSTSQSVAGGKNPAEVKITKDNLSALVAEALGNG